MAEAAQNWNLESFLDSLILELDKAQDTLSLKGVTRRLTYTVQDVSLDLQIFPKYQNGKIRFTTAEPGDTGASRLSIQLGSITDRQIRETTKDPIARDDIAIDGLEELDEDVRDSLRKVGVTSARDLEKLEKHNVDVEKVVKDKAGGDKTKSYGDLANLINKARRKRLPPSLSSIKAHTSGEKTELTLAGRHLALAQGFETFPMALLNDEAIVISGASENEMQFVVDNDLLKPGVNRLRVALDPYALMTVEIQA